MAGEGQGAWGEVDGGVFMTIATEDKFKKLLAFAAYVCDVFDQADTNHAIEDLGPRGKIARDAIEELKQVIIDSGGTVSLPPPTEQYRQFPRR